ncbi:hypothetical protein HY642_03280 [Candidatus Woesearchaeota archaeon]|nr:hypothetical protein [Candidatus Woesearchaeota archaeon]
MGVSRFVGSLLLGVIAGFIYLSSLAVIIPVLSVRTFSPNTATVLALAGAGIVVSLALATFAKGSLGKALLFLGRYTLIPGLLGIAIAVFGSDFLVTAAQRIAPYPEVVQGVAFYIEKEVPRAVTISAIYLLIGVWFIRAGFVAKRRAKALQVMKKAR